MNGNPAGEKDEKRRRILWTAVTVLYICFIYHNSLTTAVVSSQQSGRVLSLICGALNSLGMDSSWVTEHLVRKTAHFAEYTLLGILLWNCLRSYGMMLPLWVSAELCLTLFLPLVDETLQLFTEGRSGQVDDVWLDVAGVCFGTICVIAARKLLTLRRKPA